MRSPASGNDKKVAASMAANSSVSFERLRHYGWCQELGGALFGSPHYHRGRSLLGSIFVGRARSNSNNCHGRRNGRKGPSGHRAVLFTSQHTSHARFFSVVVRAAAQLSVPSGYANLTLAGDCRWSVALHWRRSSFTCCRDCCGSSLPVPLHVAEAAAGISKPTVAHGHDEESCPRLLLPCQCYQLSGTSCFQLLEDSCQEIRRT